MLERLAADYAAKTLIVKVAAHDTPSLVRRYGIAQLPGLACSSRARRSRRATGPSVPLGGGVPGAPAAARQPAAARSPTPIDLRDATFG